MFVSVCRSSFRCLALRGRPLRRPERLRQLTGTLRHAPQTVLNAPGAYPAGTLRAQYSRKTGEIQCLFYIIFDTRIVKKQCKTQGTVYDLFRKDTKNKELKFLFVIMTETERRFSQKSA